MISEADVPKRSLRTCIVKDGWKYIEGSVDESLEYPAPAKAQLFNLKDDPGERNDLAEQHPREAKNLAEMLRAQQGKSQALFESLGGEDGSTQQLSESLKRMLKEQGYL